MIVASQRPTLSATSPSVSSTLDAALIWLRRQVAPAAQLAADSRALQSGDVFLAYPVGNARQRSDGRAYIQQAWAQGAAAVLFDSEDGWMPSVADEDAGLPLLAVPQLGRLAGELAANWYGYPAATLRVIGVTGTNGKTSCSNWIAQAITRVDAPCALIGTLGTGLLGAVQPTGFTTPDAVQLQRSLSKLRAQGAKAVAMEVSSHGLDQGRLNGTAIEIAVLTNLTQDHLDYHGSMAEYAAAKARLFDWPGLQCAVINHDDSLGRQLLAHLHGQVRTLAYGLGDVPADIPAEEWLYASALAHTASGTRFTVQARVAGVSYQETLELSILGAFNVSNMLAVLGSLLAYGVSWVRALACLPHLLPVDGRMQQLGRGSGPLVVVDYAHTPDALEKTLKALLPVAQTRGGRLWSVFGCGGNRDAGKRPVMGRIAEQLASQVVLTSDNPRNEAPQAILAQIAAGMQGGRQVRQIEDRAAAILYAIKHAAAEDVVLVAGKGHEAYQESQGKKTPFSDQEHVRLALAARGVLA